MPVPLDAIIINLLFAGLEIPSLVVFWMDSPVVVLPT
jgi:hypothetical protein